MNSARAGKGCGHVEGDGICFKCWLGGMRRPGDVEAAKALFLHQFAQAEQRREQRRLRLEELKKQIPELAELEVTVR